MFIFKQKHKYAPGNKNYSAVDDNVYFSQHYKKIHSALYTG